MKFLLLFLLSVAGILAQAPTTPPATTGLPATPTAWTVFFEGGAQTSTTLTEGIGLAATVAPNTQLFVELSTLVPGGSPSSTDLLFGVKTDLPSVKSITPFTIVAYGGTLTSIAKLTSVPTGVTGVNTTSVTALGTDLGFAQEYAAGVEKKLSNGLVVGVGEILNKTSTSAWKPTPFIYIGKSF